MIKFLTSCALLGLLASCDIASGIMTGLKASEGDPNTGAPAVALTREMVDAGDTAMIGAKAGDSDPYWTYFVAQSDSNGAVSFGKQGRVAVTFRGGLVISQYVLGNHLIGVMPNEFDPIQNQRPLANWPTGVTRTYVLPGEGLVGDRRSVQCRYQTLGQGRVVIIEEGHDTTLVAEHCEGAGLDFENRYMVDAGGLVWKSEQWAGRNTTPLFIEIVEPLD